MVVLLGRRDSITLCWLSCDDVACFVLFFCVLLFLMFVVVELFFTSAVTLFCLVPRSLLCCLRKNARVFFGRI